MQMHPLCLIFLCALSTLTAQETAKTSTMTTAIDTTVISADYPYAAHFANVRGARMHYLDEGDPNAEYTFVLLHGNPTSSYIWRNVVPHLTPHGRVVAPDLIGMGKSDKPDIDYTYADHIAYMDDFLDQITTERIIFVIQDWGSGIGFHYAHRFPERVAGIVFLEAIVRTITWGDANLIEWMIFKRFRHPTKGYKMIVKNNFFVKRFLPMMTRRKLTKEERARYAEPYLREEDRKAVWIWPTQIAISGQPEESHRIIAAYEAWLPTSPMPKLMFHAKPGMIIKPKEAQRIKATWSNLEAIDLGKGKHYLQETYPHEIGRGIAEWFVRTYE